MLISLNSDRLDNLFEFHDSGFITQKHEDGKNTILMIRFVRIGNNVFCTGQAMARNNFNYEPTIPKIYHSNDNVHLTGQNREEAYVSTATIIMSNKGELYTNYPYNDQVFVFTTVYKAKYPLG